MRKIDIQKMWKFIRGDLSVSDFEKFVYSSSNLEKALEKEFYFQLISTDYKSKNDLWVIKSKIEDFLENFCKSKCCCITLSSLVVFYEYDYFVMKTLKELKKITHHKNNNCLELQQCPVCKEFWVVILEPITGVYCLKRLTKSEYKKCINDLWPGCFTSFVRLLELISSSSVEKYDLGTDAIIFFMIKLKKENNISASKISSLLNISENSVNIHLKFIEELCQERSNISEMDYYQLQEWIFQRTGLYYRILRTAKKILTNLTNVFHK